MIVHPVTGQITNNLKKKRRKCDKKIHEKGHLLYCDGYLKIKHSHTQF